MLKPAAATSELTAWLAERDRNAPAPRAHTSGGGAPDGLKSQDVAEVRRGFTPGSTVT